MNELPQLRPSILAPKTRLYRPLASLSKAILAGALMVSIIGGYTYWISLSSPWWHHDAGDTINQEEQQQRLKSFKAIDSIRLKLISESEIPAAIDTMQLSANAEHAVLADVANARHKFEATAAQPLGDTDFNLKTPPQRAAPIISTPLAWITLWDTDNEDGDVVRIDSGGYSRTVTLTKQTTTFAVPVPANGVISVIGVRDGEGGGITVGLASGASKAVFPIMSVGQTLALKVKVN